MQDSKKDTDVYSRLLDSEGEGEGEGPGHQEPGPLGISWLRGDAEPPQTCSAIREGAQEHP